MSTFLFRLSHCTGPGQLCVLVGMLVRDSSNLVLMFDVTEGRKFRRDC